MHNVSTCSLSLLVVLLATGCPEPPSDLGTAPPPSGPTGGGGAVAGGGEGGGGQPVTSGENGGRIPPGMRIEPEGFDLEEGEGVKLSGSIAYDGEIDGQLRVEILQPGGEGQGPQLLHALTLDGLGTWSVIAPTDLGEINVVAYLDRDQNGPSLEEPAALPKGGIDVGQADISGIDLVLSVQGSEGSGKQPPPPTLEAPAAAPVEAPAEAPPEGEAVEAPAQDPVAPEAGEPEAAAPPKAEG